MDCLSAAHGTTDRGTFRPTIVSSIDYPNWATIIAADTADWAANWSTYMSAYKATHNATHRATNESTYAAYGATYRSAYGTAVRTAVPYTLGTAYVATFWAAISSAN